MSVFVPYDWIVTASKVARVAVARDDSVSAAILGRLADASSDANDADGSVRIAVSGNPSTPPETLARLADSVRGSVRRTVAQNPSTPPTALECLAGDGDADVRRAVATHSSSPPATLARLAGDKEWDVRAVVARNPNTPAAILGKLVGDANDNVRRNAAKQLKDKSWSVTVTEQLEEITDHHDGLGLNDAISIRRDGRDSATGGNGSHLYVFNIQTVDGPVECGRLQFQHGPRNAPGNVPGLTTAAVIAALIDQLRGFQAGSFACRENALVITKLEEALMWTHKRARDRANRGVLGKNEK